MSKAIKTEKKQATPSLLPAGTDEESSSASTLVDAASGNGGSDEESHVYEDSEELLDDLEEAGTNMFMAGLDNTLPFVGGEEDDADGEEEGEDNADEEEEGEDDADEEGEDSDDDSNEDAGEDNVGPGEANTHCPECGQNVTIVDRVWWCLQHECRCCSAGCRNMVNWYNCGSCGFQQCFNCRGCKSCLQCKECCAHSDECSQSGNHGED